jgi:hypothetical protein
MASSGGLPPPCSILTAPCSSETAVPHRDRRSRPCWRTCFCIPRSTPGWPGGSPPSSSSATPTTRQDQGRVLQGRQPAWLLGAHVLHVPGVHVPGPRSPWSSGGTCSPRSSPAISKEALKRLSRTVRRWQLHRRTELSLAELAEMINPVVRGWMQYYGAFYRSALSMLLARINTYLGALDPQEVPTATCPQEGPRSLGPRHHAVPRLLRPLGVGQVPRDDQDGTSGVTGDCHAPFGGRPG